MKRPASIAKVLDKQLELWSDVNEASLTEAVRKRKGRF